MKTNQHLKIRCSVSVLSSLCCIASYASPALGQSPAGLPNPQIQADAQVASNSATEPIASNPLAKLEQADPSNLLERTAEKTVVPPFADYSNRQNRATELDSFSWQPANLRHRRLFFEDAAIEREAQTRRAGNLTAGLHFLKSFVQLPMRLVTGK